MRNWAKACQQGLGDGIHVVLTFILDVGMSESAARLRSLASNLRQCSDDVFKARSNSSRFNSDVRNVSAPEGVAMD